MAVGRALHAISKGTVQPGAGALWADEATSAKADRGHVDFRPYSCTQGVRRVGGAEQRVGGAIDRHRGVNVAVAVV